MKIRQCLVYILIIFCGLKVVRGRTFFQAVAELLIPALLPDEDAYFSTDRIIRKYGYPVEIHEILTEDGYILTTFRIPHGKKGVRSHLGNRTREPVLINHGILASSVHWLLLTPNAVLPFLYADAGFDVWLGNFRGTKYAMKHKAFGPKDDTFWRFSADEIGKYDIPAQIDYILNVTQQSQLVYFGFSLSTTVVFMTLSEMPEYNGKIRRLTAVAPAVYISHLRTPFIRMFPLDTVVLKFFDNFFHGEFLTDQFIQPIAPLVCNTFPRLCYFIFSILRERNPQEIARRTLVRLSGQFPDTTSARVVVHILQFIRSGNFSKYDYGEYGNYVHYGSFTPPLYNLTRVTVPVCGLYGLGDKAVVPHDAKRTLKMLPNWCNRGRGAIQSPSWKHSDNIFGKGAGKLVYARSILFSLQRGPECSC